MASESTIEHAAAALRLAVAGGGTGGHVFPAVSVIEELRRRGLVEALWIGSRQGIERDAARDLGVAYRAVHTGKLRRYASLETVADIARVPLGVVQAWRILRTYRPHVLFSTGGFVSVPSVIAAHRLGIPTVTHEQTADLGLATKINARFADVVALSYDRSRAGLRARARVIVTGNPVRASLRTGDPVRGRQLFGLPGQLPLVYVTGGAQGARAINAAVRDALPTLLQQVEILHQTGPASFQPDLDTLQSAAATLPDELRARYVMRERIGPELPDVYAAAALVIGRAGAGTVAELAHVGLPSLLVPLPGAEEQRQNALFLVEAGAAIMLPQDGLSPESLTHHVLELIAAPEKLAVMREAARAASPDAPAERLADEIVRLAGGRAS